MTPAVDENLLRERLPRSDATVQRYAQPVNDQERRGFRMLWRYVLIVLALVGVLIVAHVDALFVVAVCLPAAIYPALVLVLRKQAGHASELVRSGRAYVAQAECLTGRGRGGSMNVYQYKWTDEGGNPHVVAFPRPKRNAPAQTSEAIVLDNGNRQVVGIVVAGRMFVPGRGRQ